METDCVVDVLQRTMDWDRASVYPGLPFKRTDIDDELFNNATILRPSINEVTLGNIITHSKRIHIDLRNDNEFYFDEHFFDIPADSWLLWKSVERQLNIDIVGFELSRDETVRSNGRCNQILFTLQGIPRSVN